MLPADQRPHLGIRVGAVVDDDLVQASTNGIHERIRDVPDGDRHGDRHTPFPGTAVRSAHRSIRRHIDVRIGEDHHVVLRAAEGLHPLAVRGPRFVDVAGDRGGPDEADRPDLRMRQDPIDRHLVAVHDVEDAGRQARFLQQFAHEHRGARVFLRGLEDEGIPAGDRVGEHPHGNHRREVERRDTGDDAERLTDGIHVDPGRRLLRELALEQLGDAACELDILDAARDLSCRIRYHLPVLRGDDARQVVGVLHQEFAESEHDVRPFGQRGGAPPRERAGRGRHRGVDLVGGRQGDFVGLFAGCRVEDRRGTSAGTGRELVIDPEVDALHGGPFRGRLAYRK